MDFFKDNWKTILVWFAVLAFLFLVPSCMSISATNSAANYEQEIAKNMSDLKILKVRKVTLLDELIAATKTGVSAESGILEKIVGLRSKTEGDISTALNVMAEQYPQLKSIDNFGKVMTEMAITENGIATQSQYINETITSYNKLFVIWPSSMFLAGYPKQRFELYNIEADPNYKPQW